MAVVALLVCMELHENDTAICEHAVMSLLVLDDKIMPDC